MSQANQNNNHDNTLTKIFVGNLAWTTTTENLRLFFQQFGEVIDANVVCETYPGRSKGYGFVTFRDAASAARALENPAPVIDGRKTNCNLASRGAKNNMNHPNKNGSLNRAGPSHQYQPSPQYVYPYNSPINWDPYFGQYHGMYNNPWHPNPTQMFHYYGLPNMQQQNWHQTNRQPVRISAPQSSSVQIREINETDQEAAPQRASVGNESDGETNQEDIADVAHHDNEEAVTKPDSDVALKEAKVQGETIGQDGDIKQDAGNQEGKINEQDGDIKQDVDEEINGIKKDVESREVEIVFEQENGTKQDETKEFDNELEVTHQNGKSLKK